MAKSTKAQNRNKSPKPSKPSADFPLFPHANRQWAKKIRGKLHYFGSWDDPQAALNRWLDEKDDLLAGRVPRKATGGLTLKDLADRFLTEKRHFIDSGELSVRTYKDYHAVCQFLCDVLGKNRLATDVTPQDFAQVRRAFSEVHGPVRLGKDVTIVRMLFKWGFESELMENAVRFGPTFKPPTKKNLRKAKRANGKKDFEADEIRRLLAAVAGKPVEVEGKDEPVTMKVDPQLRAMILLGINCGFGQKDCADLTVSALNLENGWVDYPRPKTEVERRAPLWPETVEALRAAIADCPKAKSPDDADCVFLTRYGNRWVRMSEHDDPAKQTAKDAVAQQFGKVMKALGINGNRGFYSLRHSFETQAGESRDQVAVDRIMGHADNSMAGNYRHHISDERLIDVANVVRSWLWPNK